MTSTVPQPDPTPTNAPIQYPAPTIERAERAICCAPFRLQLFTTMRQQSVDLRAITGNAGVEQGYTHRPISELVAENALLWLIQVGILRREVDGQGLTDSFRLTPLGQTVVDKWQQHGNFPSVSWFDRGSNALNRWFRLPSWLF